MVPENRVELVERHAVGFEVAPRYIDPGTPCSSARTPHPNGRVQLTFHRFLKKLLGRIMQGATGFGIINESLGLEHRPGLVAGIRIRGMESNSSGNCYAEYASRWEADSYKVLSRKAGYRY